MCPTQVDRFDEPVNQTSQSKRHQKSSNPIDAACSGTAALGNMAKRNGDHGRRNREIDEEHPAPRSMLDQPSPEHRPNSGSDCGEAGPGADCLSAAFLVERCADNRKAARNEQCSSHALNASGDDQLMNVQRNSATSRSHREDGGSDDEDQATSEQVAERTTDENQGSQKQSV